MPGAWSGTPATYTPSELVTDVIMNAELRDRMLWLGGTTGVMPSIHATGFVVDSGGLQVTIGNLSIGTTPVATQGLTVSASFSGTNVYGIRDLAALTANTINASLIGQSIELTPNPNAQTNAVEYGLLIPLWNASGSANAYGIQVSGATGGGTNNYGIYVNAPAGASGVNEGIHNEGSLKQNGTWDLHGASGSFFGATAVGRQTLTGSRSGGAALVSVIAALVNLGLTTDSTSA